MNIKELAAAIRANQIKLDNATSHFQIVRLSDRRWDLTAAYDAKLKAAGLDKA